LRQADACALLHDNTQPMASEQLSETVTVGQAARDLEQAERPDKKLPVLK